MRTLDRAQQYFDEFRMIFEPALGQYLIEKLEQLQGIDPMGRALAEKIRDFSATGGKRIRPALVVLGYRAGGGDREIDVMPAAIGMELLHSFFLIHDDIIDQSELRRGRPTIHKMFEADYHQLLRSSTERQHFGYSMALLAGDLCCAIAYEALTSSNFPADRIVRAIQKMHSMVNATAIGQGLDLTRPLEDEVTEEAVIQIYLLKTAKYTIEGPLHLGLILAGASDQLLEEISRYALPVGIAFQIQDDILGVFGAEEELGKSITSDIKEGKQTILTVTARMRSTDVQRERLRCLLGNPYLSSTDIEEVRESMRVTGALAYARSRAQALALEGKVALPKLPIAPDIREILEGLADYIVERAFC